MEKQKNTDSKILGALMKNSKISDRQLAREIGVSQPTVTRKRAKLEQKFLDGYTAIPKWKALGFEILAITMVKSYQSTGLKDKFRTNVERSADWMMKHPNVIFSGGSRGMNKNGVLISVHRNYSEFDEFMSEHKRELGDMFSDIETAIVNLGGGEIIKPLHLRYLAEVV